MLTTPYSVINNTTRKNCSVRTLCKMSCGQNLIERPCLLVYTKRYFCRNNMCMLRDPLNLFSLHLAFHPAALKSSPHATYLSTRKSTSGRARVFFLFVCSCAKEGTFRSLSPPLSPQFSKKNNCFSLFEVGVCSRAGTTKYQQIQAVHVG